VELRQLRYFVAVAQEHSFTRAAEKLGIAQPPLSRQLQQFEEELGVELIRRGGGRPAYLTEAGQLLYEQAIQVLDRIEEMRAMMQRLQHATRGRFGIGFVASTLYGKLPEVLRRFRASRPGFDVALLELTSLEQITALKEHRIDVGFGRIPLDDPEIRRVLLRHERLVAALPVGSPLLDSFGPLPLRELTRDPLIVYPKAPRPSYADQVLALFRAHHVSPFLVTEVRELQAALGLVAAHAGFTIVPASVQRLQREGVEYRELQAEDARSPIFLTHRIDDSSEEVAAMIELIRDIYREEGIIFGQ